MYGSFRQDQRLKETYIDHSVTPGETLAGIALKYGSSTDAIKRANNLWTNESLALKKHLFIPIPVTEGNVAAKPATPDHQPNRQDSGTSPVASDPVVNGNASEDPSEPVTPTASDFFSKFDANIAQLKTSVDRLESESRVHLLPGMTSHTPPLLRSPNSSAQRPRPFSDSPIRRLHKAPSTASTSSDDPFGYPDVRIRGRGSMAQLRSDTEDQLFQL